MKKVNLFLFSVLLTIQVVNAQINWGEYSQSFSDEAMDKTSTAALILAIPENNNAFWAARERSKHFDTLAKDSSFQQLRPKDIIARTTFDTAKAHFFLHGVNQGNAQAYQFRVTVYPTNRVLVPWKTINRFTDDVVTKDSGLPQMAYLGGYKTELGNMLIMDVRKTGSNQIVATAMVAWESIKPIVTNIYTSANLDEFFKRLQYPWAGTTSEKGTQQSEDPRLPSTDSNLIFFLKANIRLKEQVQYELIRNGTVFIPWKDNDYDNSFIWLKNNPPGKYLIKIRYVVQPTHVSEYRFEVAPAWYQSSQFRIISGFFLAAFCGALLLLILFIRQKRKTRQELFNKNKVHLELKSIYAQLNPHFVFNALSSIQGLINKQDIQGANNYLSDFAKLMRESLHNSNKDEVSLKEELQTLETYLKLEQLRFGFQYNITVNDDINIYDTSIPSLLLQPLVENAVKHGVSSLHKAGVVSMSFGKAGNTMVAVIADNGKGFAARSSTGGLGLKLTNDRIKLLNQLNQQQQITMEIRNNLPSGSRITIIFNNWFL